MKCSSAVGSNSISEARIGLGQYLNVGAKNAYIIVNVDENLLLYVTLAFV